LIDEKFGTTLCGASSLWNDPLTALADIIGEVHHLSPLIRKRTRGARQTYYRKPDESGRELIRYIQPAT